jgi:dCTP deaminase
VPLSDLEIWAELNAGRLRIEPRDPERIKYHTIDLRLGPEIFVFPEVVAGVTIEPELVDILAYIEKDAKKIVLSEDQPFPMPRGVLVIGKTLEKVTLPDYLAARVEGKSSFARLGLQTHMTAPTIHPGFTNMITLELLNNGPYQLALKPGMDIAQLIIERLGSPSIRTYSGRFQGPSNP